MQHPTYSETAPPVKPFRQKVAPRVIEQHSRRCERSAKGSRRCTCVPSYVARVKRGEHTHAQTFGSLADAVAWAQDARETVRRGRAPIVPVRVEATFGDVATSFVKNALAGTALTRSRGRFASTTLDGYEIALRRHVLPWTEPRTGLPLRDVSIADFDGRMAQGVIDHIAVRSRPSARTAAAAIRNTLRYAYQRGLTDTMPPALELPPPPPRRTRVLSSKQLAAIQKAATADDREQGRSMLLPLVALLSDTGLRVSEALGLVWGPGGIVLAGETPHVTVARSTTKTDAGVRRVPLAPATVAALRRHRLACGRPVDGALVFTDKRGHALRRWHVRTGFERLAKTTGIEFSAHVFRHSHATELAAANVPPAAAAQRLGHADGGVMFLRVYAHPGDAAR